MPGPQPDPFGLAPRPGVPTPTGGSPAPGGGTPPTVGAPPSQNDAAQQFQSQFSQTPYYNTQGFQTVLNGFLGSGALNSSKAASDWGNVLQGYANTFASQFQNYVGRAPTADEYNQFFTQVVAPLNQWNTSNPSGAPQISQANAQVQQELPGFLNSNFQNAQQQYNTQQLQQAADKATAPGSAFDQWQQGYQNSINNVTTQLQNYQQQLFQKLQPNLITSLASKGLLNSGALNQAFAGAATDLGNAGTQYVAGLQGQEAQDVAQQKFNIMNAPNASAISNLSYQIPNMSTAGNAALQNAFNYDASANMQNLGYQNQQGLLNQQYSNQPNPLSQYGGLILGGLASGAGKGLAGGLFA